MKSANTPDLPLAGLQVLDLTRLLPGAFCTQMLADMGAEVIKVEQPGTGDYWRWIEPRVVDQSYALLALCAKADVLVESFRPGVMDRLGVGHEVLRERFPELIYCAITGFGQTGPHAQLAAHDLNYLGMTGLLQYVVGSKTAPRPTALPVGDIGAGAQMAIPGILAALLARERGAGGRLVDISIVDGLFSWAGFMTSQWNLRDRELASTPFDEPFDKPFYTVYETADGKHMVVGAYEPKFWENLCNVLGVPEWIERQWANGDEEAELRAVLAGKFRQRRQSEWIDLFSRHEACVTPVLDIIDALRGPHATERGTTIQVDDPIEGRLQHIACPIRFDGVAYSASSACPTLGQHTQELLGAVGYSDEEIARLRELGVA